MRALRALAALLTYPNPELAAAVLEMRDVIDASRGLGRASKERLANLLAELASAEPYEREERYVALFDRGRATSLHLFEHVHGDSRARGQALVDLRQIYERAGFYLADGELPDYLPALLEYLSCRPSAEVRETLGDCAHILRAIGEQLARRGSHYAAVFDALLELVGQSGLDWSQATAAVPETPDVDDDWMEAPAFGPAADERPAVAVMQFTPRKTK